MAEEPKLELLFADDTYQLTGVAVSKQGRLFTNYPLWPGSHKYSLVEVFANNEVKPYPNLEMNTWKEGDNGKNKWVCVQAVYIDDTDAMWVVDPACPFMEQVYVNSHKLVKINLQTNQVEKTWWFEGIASDKSYLNDVRVDTSRGFAYLTNSNEGGIVVVDLNSGKIKQVLQKHYSVKSDPAFKFIVDGKEFSKKGEPAKMHSDGIALTPDGLYLYYKPLTDNKLYRIKTQYLRNNILTGEELEKEVEDLGAFITTDGMICDKQGNLYLGDLQESSIVKISPELTVTTVVQNEKLIWPDSYSISDDDYLYISCSQIQKQPDYNEGENKRTTPYTIYRMKIPS
jgi:sugar lactone lactonase YvrE